VAAQAHNYNKVQGLEYDRDLQGRKLIGENIVDFVTATTSDVSVALRGGFLDGHFTIGATGRISGRITGGSGRFAGDTGTIGGEATPTVAHVVLTYHR